MNDIAKRLAQRLFNQRLIGNQYRSDFIEEMIRPVLSKTGWTFAGADWGGWDFEREADEKRLELKQSAAEQVWSKPRGLRTRGAFDIASRTGHYSEHASKWEVAPGRPAHVYVFAWNGVEGEKADHRDSAQWEFHVVKTSDLPRKQKTITLYRVRKLADPVPLAGLAKAVDEVLTHG
ncbi:MAG: hypothetical protein AAF354_09275 [Pseudomonadota bacterium]